MSLLGSILGALLPPLFPRGPGSGGSGPGEAGGADGQNGPDAPTPGEEPGAPPASGGEPAPDSPDAPTVSLTQPAALAPLDMEALFADDMDKLRQRALAVQAEILTADLIERLKTPPEPPASAEPVETTQDVRAAYSQLGDEAPAITRAA